MKKDLLSTGLHRRDFLASVLTATVFCTATGKVLGQVVPKITGSDDDSVNNIQAQYQLKLSDYPALATVNQSITITNTGLTTASVIVMRISATEFSALENRCPHEGGAMGTFNANAGRFTCTLHGARFTATGGYISGPTGGAGLRRFNTSYNEATEILTISTTPLSVIDSRFDGHLIRNYPNPATTSTVFEFALDKPEKVRLEIADIRGVVLSVVLDEYLAEGTHTIPFSLDNFASGNYSYILTTSSGFKTVRTLSVVR